MDAFSYFDEPRSGLMNMAIDDAMLAFAEKHQVVVLRVYQWAEPTLSLGYFQTLEEREQHEQSRNIALVRRATGGGAIVHDHDLTYSLAIPQRANHVGAAPKTYAAVHVAMVEWLNELGLPAARWQPTYNIAEPSVQHKEVASTNFLCFQRRSDGDVVVGGHKVMGSAQRRAQGALLQHGSLLLRRSSYAFELPGIGDLVPQVLDRAANGRLFAREMQLRLERGIDALLGVRLKCEEFLAIELMTCATSKMSKFESPQWRGRV